MHLNSQLLFSRFAKPHFKPGMRVLEIGPDAFPSTYSKIIALPEIEWQTADLVASAQDRGQRLFGEGRLNQLTFALDNAYSVPAPAASFDILVSGQVIEHVRRIWAWMQELARLTAHGGLVITIAPISWPYHEAPVDCWRIYPEGMRALCEEAGLEVLLSTFAALEPRVSKRWYPGESSTLPQVPRSLFSRLKQLIKGGIGWPMTAAVDTITIARKP